MSLNLVEPESSRILCCKVYKRIGVAFRWFFPEECFKREQSCESVVFTFRMWRFIEVGQRSRVHLAEAVLL